MTQKEMILDFLRRRTRSGDPYTLTPMKAFSKLHITKLATRVSELIDDGYPIKKQMIKKYDKKTGKLLTHYMSYSLEADDDRIHMALP